MGTITETDRDKILSQCKWHVDSGHAWLEVPNVIARKAHEADISTGGDGISMFSYVKGRFAYLEQDCDAPLFMKYLGGLDCETWNEIHANGEVSYTDLAPIRNYPRWEA